MKSQLKALPPQQQEMIIGAMESNPEFFTKIAKEIKAKTKAGMDQQTASMQVMLAHKNELQKIMMGNQK